MRYSVSLVQRLYQTVTVEADSENEAADLASYEADPEAWESDGIESWDIIEEDMEEEK